MSLENKVALVLGGNSGVGNAICLSLAEQGARLAVAGTDLNNIQDIVEQVKEKGAEAISITSDISTSENTNQIFARAIEKYSGIDIFIYALALDYILAQPVSSNPVTEKLTDDDWHNALTATLHGAFFCTREALRLMGEKHYGKIVYIIPQTEVIGYGRRSHLSAASGGILGLMVGVARRAAANGINMNAITPGPLEAQVEEAANSEPMQQVAQRMPGGRMGKPEDIANMALHLVSDEASFMVGQVVSPNGGFNTKWV